MSTNPNERGPLVAMAAIGVIGLLGAVGWQAYPGPPQKPEARGPVTYEVEFARDGGSWQRGVAESVPRLTTSSSFVMRVIPQTKAAHPEAVTMEVVRAGARAPFGGEASIQSDGTIVLSGRVGHELAATPGPVALVVKVAGVVAGTQSVYVDSAEAE